MINAIAELGQFEKSKNPDLTSFDIWLEDSYDGGKYPNVLLIEFKKEKNEKNADITWSFSRIDAWENSPNLKSKLLYKRHASRGCDKTPTGKVSDSIEKTFNQKIVGWFSSNIEKKFLLKDQKQFLKSILEELKKKSGEILESLNKNAELLETTGIVLSPVFLEDGKQKFIGDYNFFENFITEESKLAYKYSKTFKKYSFSKDKTCSICNQNKEEVFGYFTSLAFYTVDKPGMVTGGFCQDKSWINYPVCLDCALNVEMGINLMEKDLSFKFYGLQYYLLPKTTNENNKRDIIDIILNYKKSPKISDSNKERLTNDEDEVFDLLKEEGNNITLNFLFYEKPQKGVLRILVSIEDIVPSRIKKLFDAKDFVDNLLFFKDHKTKDGKRMFRFSFGTLRTFFSNSKITGNNDKYFLELTQKIFNDSKIDYQFIVQNIICHIRNLFVNNELIWIQTMQGFMLINFLNKLNLFRRTDREVGMDQQFFESFQIESKEDFESKVTIFFDNFSEFFINDAHRGIFLIGVLTQFLLNIQKKERNSTPFRSKLKGLKMDGRDISVLLPEIIEKLEQYRSNYYIPLENLISKYLVSAGNYQNWNLPVDEMNFIFVLGMNLSQYFKIPSKKN